LYSAFSRPWEGRLGASWGLAEFLDARRPEIEQTILARAYSVSDPSGVSDPGYISGLRDAVAAAVRYGLAGVEGPGPAASAPIPAELFAQARRAARSGVSLETILRRYVAGHTVLTDYVMREAERVEDLNASRRRWLAGGQAVLFDRLVEAVASEYRAEIELRSRSLHQRRAACVQKLLSGQLADPDELGYELEAWHVGAVVAGVERRGGVRELAAALDRRLLLTQRGEDALWLWFGGSHPLDICTIEEQVHERLPEGAVVAVGEPGVGLSGWRLTHLQAVAALAVARRSARRFTRYADVALLASALRDEVLVRSLNEIYLAPLAHERDGGKTLRRTLRAYFAAGRNVSSAAAALGVNRRTVANRLQTVESLLGRALCTCIAELEAALRLEELGQPDSGATTGHAPI
jgi:PucR C-terminal helix-turn-helix domain/GGDEF-like domain